MSTERNLMYISCIWINKDFQEYHRNFFSYVTSSALHRQTHDFINIYTRTYVYSKYRHKNTCVLKILAQEPMCTQNIDTRTYVYSKYRQKNIFVRKISAQEPMCTQNIDIRTCVLKISTLEYMCTQNVDNRT